MFDIRAIRDNPDAFRKAWNRRKDGLGSVVDDILKLDADWRAATSAKQEAESARNANSKLIGKAKAEQNDAKAAELMALVAKAKADIEAASAAEDTARKALDDILMGLPNLPLDEVPDGADEQDNVEQHRWGEPRLINDPKDHADLGEALKGQGGFSLMDFEAAARMSGARFVALRGKLTRLERALANFMLDLQTQPITQTADGKEIGGYEEMSVPLLVKDRALVGTGQLPKFEIELFRTAAKTEDTVEQMKRLEQQFAANTSIKHALSEFDNSTKNHPQSSISKFFTAWHTFTTEYDSMRLKAALERSSDAWPFVGYLAPTSEVPLTNLVREQILEASQLPLRFTAHTPCFRSEAGSAGRDTKGMIRQHQFYKVELVSIVAGEKEGLEELERMTSCAEEVLKRLELPFRRMLLCTGDMGAGARKTYDLEVWLPSQNTYREISSCSYCGDFQARRMDARYRPEPKAKTEFVHTLNGSGLAVGRTLVAVLENYQNADGSITVPKALVPYMGGIDRID